MVEAGLVVFTFFVRQIEYIRFSSDTVIVAGNETLVRGGKNPNEGKTEHLRFTGVCMKQSVRWQRVARHANIVPSQ